MMTTILNHKWRNDEKKDIEPDSHSDDSRRICLYSASIFDGFLRCLEPTELLLYLFLTLVSDAQGVSYYGDSAICRLLKTNPMDLEQDRQVLISHDLIAYDPPFYQVLELPCKSQTTNIQPESQSHSSSPSSFSQLIKRMEN